MKYSLDKFYKKLQKEALIKSLICGISASLILNSLIIILFKRIPIRIIVFVHVLLFVVLSICFTYLFFKKVFVITDKYLAKRIEKDVHLNEQVKTMVEFQNVDSPIVELQRKKTMEELEKVETKSLKMKFSFKNFALSILALILLPISIIVESKEIKSNAEENSSSESSSNEEESSNTNSEQQDSSNIGESSGGEQGSQGEGEGDPSEGMNDTIDNMQQEVTDNEGLDDSQKEDINQDLEDMRQDINNSENKEEMEESIDKTQQEVNDKLDEAISKDEIGEALKNQDTTQDVGENVSSGDTEQTNSSLDDLRDSLENLTGDELKEALDKIASDIDKALEESGVDNQDPLYQAFENMSNNLKENASNANNPDIQDQIDDTFEQAKQEISDALKDQNAMEDLQGSLNDQFEDLKNQANGEGSNGENQDGEETPGEGDGQEGEGENQEGEGSGGEGAGSGSGEIIYASNDLIYDPNTNSYVTYGELLTYYYSQAVQGMEDGSVPEDLQSLINDYFSSLYYDENN